MQSILCIFNLRGKNIFRTDQVSVTSGIEIIFRKKQTRIHMAKRKITYMYNSFHHSSKRRHLNYGHRHNLYHNKIQKYIAAESSSMGLDRIKGRM